MHGIVPTEPKEMTTYCVSFVEREIRDCVKALRRLIRIKIRHSRTILVFCTKVSRKNVLSSTGSEFIGMIVLVSPVLRPESWKFPLFPVFIDISVLRFHHNCKSIIYSTKSNWNWDVCSLMSFVVLWNVSSHFIGRKDRILILSGKQPGQLWKHFTNLLCHCFLKTNNSTWWTE